MSEKIIKWNDKLLRWNGSYIRTETITPPAPPPVYPTDGLIERWDFNSTLEGLNGTTWAVEKGAAVYGTEGPGSSPSLTLDGNDGYSTTASSVINAITGDVFSFSMWIKSTWSSGYPTVISGQPYAATKVWVSMIAYNEAKAHFGMEKYATYFTAAVTADNLFDGTLQHWVGTYDGTRFQNYIDGSVNGSQSDVVADAPTITKLYFGYDPNNAGRDIVGNIALFYIYNKVLSQDEINLLYNNGSGA